MTATIEWESARFDLIASSNIALHDWPAPGVLIARETRCERGANGIPTDGPFCVVQASWNVPCWGEMDVKNELVGQQAGPADASFESWFRSTEPRLRAALVAAFGPEFGRDATAEALSYVWEHRDRVLALDNAAGYAFRVGQRWGRRQRARQGRRFGMPPIESAAPGFEPALHEALTALSTRQRQVVVLCIGYGLTHAEAADLLNISRSSVQNHRVRS